MKKVLMAMIFGALVLTTASFAQTPPEAAPPVAPAAVKAGHHEHHPEIMKASRKLRGAKHDLQLATHDFGGHKAKAIAAIDAALRELHEAMAFDKQ